MTYKSAQDIACFLGLGEGEVRALEALLDQFPMRIPEYYFSLIDPGDPNDPIKKMCIPTNVELDPDGSFDTSGEGDNTVLPGLQHKYRQTALILSTNRCAMYCRHCFRKRLVGLTTEEVAEHLGEIAAYIRENTDINNVLVSGGDAFLNDNQTLERYLKALTPIPHLDYIRFGTRTPVVSPDRIYADEELLALLRQYGADKQLMVVTQFNHPRELTGEARRAVRCLTEAGVAVRNQAVLLQGVNDDPETLGTLLRALTAFGVFPYYVFQCRPVTGVKNNFQVPIRRGLQIIEGAKAYQSGLGKAFRYCLSHPTGKIEVIGELSPGQVLFKYHEAKYPEDNGRMFTMDIGEDQTWLYDLPPR